MNRAYLLLGSNAGEREQMLRDASIELIDALLPSYLEIDSLENAVNSSEVIETEPWGEFEPDANGGVPEKFLNQAIMITTELEPQQVLDICRNIEKMLGRGEEEHRGELSQVENGHVVYKSRCIDIDILLFEKQVRTPKGEMWRSVEVCSEELVIPHPHLHKREFALAPLAAVAPNAYHPVLKKRVKELLKDLKRNA